MRILLIVLAVASGCAVGLAACDSHPGPAVPSTKRVDSIVAAAPDTIKAISTDSIPQKAYMRDSAK